MIPLSFGLSRYTANTVMPLRTVDLGKFKKETPESYSGARRQNVREYMPKVVLETARIGVICGASACPEARQAQVP